MIVRTPFGDADFLGLGDITPRGYILLVERGWMIYRGKK